MRASFAALAVLVVLAVLVCAVLGCAAPLGSRESRGPYQPAEESRRDTVLAERLSRDAAAALDAGNLDEAEALLREALTADLFFGPAHNNLGVVFLERGELYEAASELEWARKLMPGHPDPRVNLALALEEAGRNAEALASYTAALEVYPGYLPAIQGAASLAVRTGSKDERLGGWLEEIALRGESGAWRDWALAYLSWRR